MRVIGGLFLGKGYASGNVEYGFIDQSTAAWHNLEGILGTWASFVARLIIYLIHETKAEEISETILLH